MMVVCADSAIVRSAALADAADRFSSHGGDVKIYTYSEARQNLATLLDEARRKGGVRIRRRDGASFILRPEMTASAPLMSKAPNSA
jgi:hypothetical protein